MKTILLALGALVVLGGGGIGAYMYFMKPAEASAVEKLDAEPEEHAEGEEHGLLSTVQYYELDPLILPIVDKTGVSQTVSIVVSLELPNSASKTKAQDISPKLKDAYIQDMYGVLNKHAALKGGVLQVNLLKKRLNKVSKRILGEDSVNDVLLQVVQQRPI